MDHVLQHQSIKLWLGLLIRKFSRDETVNVFRGAEFGVGVEKDDHVHVGQASLLEFNAEEEKVVVVAEQMDLLP
jgi:hypothetical protein